MARSGIKAKRLEKSQICASGIDVMVSKSSYVDIEAGYLTNTPLEHRKRLGQFFTPLPIANLMCNWIMEIDPKEILDPAVGLGVFVSEIYSRDEDIQITAIDIDPKVLNYAKHVYGSDRTEFIEGDFLLQSEERCYDAIIANPPYLKHHDFFYSDDIFGSVGNRNQIKLSKLTNIYALFLIEICRNLRPGGRAAVIVPTEWTNANFGQPIKHFLLDRGYLRCFAYFTHESLPFSDALTTAGILFIEKPVADKKPLSTRTIYLQKGVNLDTVWHIITGDLDEVDGCIVKDIPCSSLTAEKKMEFHSST